MASELSKAKRKRTAKRNVVIKTILPQCEEILKQERNRDSSDTAKILQYELKEVGIEVKWLDEMVADLVEDDDEYGEVETSSFELGLKAKKMDTKLTAFLASVET